MHKPFASNDPISPQSGCSRAAVEAAATTGAAAVVPLVLHDHIPQQTTDSRGQICPLVICYPHSPSVLRPVSCRPTYRLRLAAGINRSLRLDERRAVVRRLVGTVAVAGPGGAGQNNKERNIQDAPELGPEPSRHISSADIGYMIHL